MTNLRFRGYVGDFLGVRWRMLDVTVCHIVWSLGLSSDCTDSYAEALCAF